MTLNKNKTGLVLGYLFAIVHLIWVVLVAIIPNALQNCVDWIFSIHGIEPVWIITEVTLVNAVLLIITTFVSGYIMGWVFAAINNLVHKK